MTQTDITDLHFIDDSPDECAITRLLLRREKIQVKLSTYPEFADFLLILRSGQVLDVKSTIVVIDLNLIVSSGIDAVRELRKYREYDDLIIGICTGSEDPKDRLDAMQAGADFFVTKPLNGVAIQRICESVDSLRYLVFPNMEHKVVRDELGVRE